MSNKSTIHAALNKLTVAAIDFAPTTDGPALLVLHSAVADAVRALPDAPAMIEVVYECDRLRAENRSLADSLLRKSARITADATQIAATTKKLAEARAATAQFATADLVATDTPSPILIELRKQTALLEVLGKQGDNRLEPAT